MLNKLPQQKYTLIPDCVAPSEVVEHINSYIENNACKNISIDISFMNVLDACYVTTLCATKHFTKYPNGKIIWKVASNMVKEFNQDLDLGNSNYIL